MPLRRVAPQPTADGVCAPPTAEAQDSGCLEDQQEQEAGFERFVGDDWYVHGAQMVIEPDSTGTTTHTLRQCTDSSESHCREITRLEFSEASSGSVVATVTSVDYETYEGNPPPPGFEPYERWQAGDSFELEFVDDNLLRTTWLGQATDLNDEPSNPYWCNSQTSDENSDECGA